MKKIFSIIFLFAFIGIKSQSSITPLNLWKQNGNTVGNNTSFIGSTDNRSITFKVNNIIFAKGDSLTGRVNIRNGLVIGSNSITLGGIIKFRNSMPLTGGPAVYANYSDNQIQNDVSVGASYYSVSASTASAASAYTVPLLTYFEGSQGSFGANSKVTQQAVFAAPSNLISAVNNYGFLGAVPTGTNNNYNLYMSGSAQNYLNGNLSIGTTTTPAKFHVLSTTEQLRLGYNTTNYLSATVSSTGTTTFDLVGTTPTFIFNKGVTANVDLLFTTTAAFDAAKPGRIYYNSGNGLNFVGKTGSTNDMGFFTPSGTGLFKNPTGTNHMCLAESGSVRIGSAVTPTATLDVTGTMSVSSTASLASTLKLGSSAVLTGGSTGTVGVLTDIGMNVNTMGMSVNPIDATTYYMGNVPFAIQGNAGIGKYYMPENYTLTKATINYFVNGTLGSAETISVSIGVDGAYTQINSTSTATAIVNSFSVTGLSQNINSGSYIETRLVCPTWATNPTNFAASVVYYFVRRP